MFRIRLSESAMPTGSKDPDVLLAWLLDSMGLVRRKSEGMSIDDEQGALHRLIRETLLSEPLKGWDTKSLGDVSGLSQTGMHHQLVKLRESGLVAAETEGRWHIHVLRGGSISAAVDLVSVQARAILDLRLSEVAERVTESDDRMVIPSEDGGGGFQIEIAEPGATMEGEDRLDALMRDLGLNGERGKHNDRLARQLFEQISSSRRAMTLLALADKTGDSRSRVQRTVERMRAAGIAERVTESDDRMVIPSEDGRGGFQIEIAEPGATVEGEDRLDALMRDLGLNGERGKHNDRLARQLFEEISSSGRATTLLALADKTGDSRSRVQRAVERMRAAGIAERVPMLDRIAQDVYAGLMRQHDARGEEWLMTRGGLGRLDESVSKSLIAGVRKKSLNIEKVQDILAPVPLDAQRVLLNTLGGRMPYGIRISGRDGAAVKERVMRQADRTLRRLRTVAQRLDESLAS